VTQPTSRKQFFAKLLGLAAVASVLPKVFAKTAVASVAKAENNLPFAIQTDSRAVVRQVDSV